jgi:hypothetical protein
LYKLHSKITTDFWTSEVHRINLILPPKYTFNLPLPSSNPSWAICTLHLHGLLQFWSLVAEESCIHCPPWHLTCSILTPALAQATMSYLGEHHGHSPLSIQRYFLQHYSPMVSSPTEDASVVPNVPEVKPISSDRGLAWVQSPILRREAQTCPMLQGPAGSGCYSISIFFFPLSHCCPHPSTHSSSSPVAGPLSKCPKPALWLPLLSLSLFLIGSHSRWTSSLSPLQSDVYHVTLIPFSAVIAICNHLVYLPACRLSTPLEYKLTREDSPSVFLPQCIAGANSVIRNVLTTQDLGDEWVH